MSPFPKETSTCTGALRYVLAVLATIQITTIITFGLGVAYSIKLARAPLYDYYMEFSADLHPYPTIYFVLYSATMPFLSIIHIAVDLSLCLLTRLSPVYALIAAIVFLCRWSGQVGFWTSCELPDGLTSSGAECRQCFLQPDEGWGFKGLPLSLANAKAAFGYLTILLYISYVIFAAVAVHKQRKQATNGLERLESEEAYELEIA